jgi:hypothetical protein
MGLPARPKIDSLSADDPTGWAHKHNTGWLAQLLLLVHVNAQLYISWFPTGSTLKCSSRDFSTTGWNFDAHICNAHADRIVTHRQICVYIFLMYNSICLFGKSVRRQEAQISTDASGEPLHPCIRRSP